MLSLESNLVTSDIAKSCLIKHLHEFDLVHVDVLRRYPHRLDFLHFDFLRVGDCVGDTISAAERCLLEVFGLPSADGIVAERGTSLQHERVDRKVSLHDDCVEEKFMKSDMPFSFTIFSSYSMACFVIVTDMCVIVLDFALIHIKTYIMSPISHDSVKRTIIIV